MVSTNDNNARRIWDVLAQHGAVPRDAQHAMRDSRGDLPAWRVPVPIECDGERYTLTVRAARISLPDGTRVSVYPTAREWEIMLVLRELADAQTEHLRDEYEPAPFAAIFSYERLGALLAEREHACTFAELEDSLEILQSAKLELRSADGTRLHSAGIITTSECEYGDVDDDAPTWFVARFGHQERALAARGAWER